MSGQGFVRAFIAIQLPTCLREEVGRLMETLRAGLPAKSTRWVRVENVHLTLRFLGNIAADEVESVKSALRVSAGDVRAFELHIGCPGCFPNWDSPRVLWIGVNGAGDALGDLQARIAGVTCYWGKPEQGNFLPHLTLGRVVTNRPNQVRVITRALRELEIREDLHWQVDEVHLMQSVTDSDGSRYNTLASVSLVA